MKRISVVLFFIAALTMLFTAYVPVAASTSAPANPAATMTTDILTITPNIVIPTTAETITPAPSEAPANPNEPVLPMPGSSPSSKDQVSNALVAAFSQKLAFTTLDYEVFKVNPSPTLEDIIAYYDAKATAAGWIGEGGKVKDSLNGNKFTIYKNTKKNQILVVSLYNKSDNASTYVLVILGSKAP